MTSEVALRLVRVLVFELELTGHALGLEHVTAHAKIDRLINTAALPERVEVTDFNDLTDLGDVVVGRNGDIACCDQARVVEQLDFDAALPIDVATRADKVA